MTDFNWRHRFIINQPNAHLFGENRGSLLSVWAMAAPRRIHLTAISSNVRFPSPTVPTVSNASDQPVKQGLLAPGSPPLQHAATRVELKLFEPDNQRCPEFCYPDLISTKVNNHWHECIFWLLLATCYIMYNFAFSLFSVWVEFQCLVLLPKKKLGTIKGQGLIQVNLGKSLVSGLCFLGNHWEKETTNVRWGGGQGERWNGGTCKKVWSEICEYEFCQDVIFLASSQVSLCQHLAN